MLRILRKDTNFEAIYNYICHFILKNQLRILRKDTNFEAIYNPKPYIQISLFVANTPQRYKF